MAVQPPLLGVTMGDPAGIGSELIVKSYSQVAEEVDLVVFGDMGVMKAAVDDCESDLALNPVESVEEASFTEGVVDIVDFGNVGTLKRGEIRAEYGAAALEYIQAATDAAVDRTVDAVVTAPIHRESLSRAGSTRSDHMDLLADRTNTETYTMLLSQGELVVSHVTVHVPLRAAVDLVTSESVLETIRMTDEGLQRLGIQQPSIAVAGLNPHAEGEEDATEIQPAIEQAQAAGIDAMGPYAPDDLFNMGTYGRYDGLVAMYHDQGHIPIYLNGMIENPGAVSGVNMTIGLPIIRTGAIQGPCFEIAGDGIARPGSLVDAMRMAAQAATGND